MLHAVLAASSPHLKRNPGIRTFVILCLTTFAATGCSSISLAISDCRREAPSRTSTARPPSEIVLESGEVIKVDPVAVRVAVNSEARYEHASSIRYCMDRKGFAFAPKAGQEPTAIGLEEAVTKATNYTRKQP